MVFRGFFNSSFRFFCLDSQSNVPILDEFHVGKGRAAVDEDVQLLLEVSLEVDLGDEAADQVRDVPPLAL